MKNLSSLGQRCKNKDEEDADEKNAKTNPFDGLVSCFLFAWFIAGAYFNIFITVGIQVVHVVVLGFYGPLTCIRSSGQSVILNTLFQGKPWGGSLPVLSAHSFASN